jgi:TonB-dependent starch-binding outer membrane protein SusC
MITQRLLVRTVLSLCLLILTQTVFAQKTVTGKVTDPKDGSPIVGASVQPKGGTSGTSTGADGSFAISVPNDVTTLVISYVGYGSVEVSIVGKTSVEVELRSDAALNLNEVVVVGYGTARRRDVTGSVQSVKAKDFNKGVIISPDQAIQGKAAGVMIISNSGQPGGATTVRIRGTSSIRSGQQPLYVIDGVPLSGNSARPGATGNGIGTTPGTNPLNFMNPADIASIEVLKDASATAIYGSRGANGVILITTKRGQTGAPTIDVGVSGGFSRIMKQLEVLNAAEYKAALQSYGLTSGNYGGDVNALDAILRTGFTQSHSVSVSAGTDNARYRASIGYLTQQGIVKESDFNKLTANFNGSFKFLESKKLGLDLNVFVSGTKENIAPISNDAGFTGSLIGQALQWNPTHPLYLPNGDIWVNNQIGATTVNPLAMLEAYDSRLNENVILASVAPYYKFTNNLEYKLLYSVNRRVGTGRGELKRWINIDNIQNRGVAGIDNGEDVTQQVTNTVSYNKEFSSNFNLNTVVGHEYLKFDNRSHGQFGFDFTDVGNLRYYDILGYASQGSLGNYSNAGLVDELQSFFGRAIMNFYDKYLLTVTLRADGSSKFGENNRYGYFPSVAAAWNITNEDFMKNSNVFSSLKLRLGWGRTGNQEFPGGAQLGRFGFGRQAITRTNFANPDLKWETSTTTNAGVDFSILGDRVSGSVDYFYKKTTDVLFEAGVAAPGPANTRVWQNLDGAIVNKGVEIVLYGGLVRNKDINWNLGLNLSFLDNEVTGLPGFFETGALHGQGISGARAQRNVSGQPLNSYYLSIFEGIDKATGQGIYRGGDPANNKFYVGSPNPTSLVGISTDFSYKRFSAIINMNGVLGHKLYNNTANTVLPIGNLGSRNIAKTLVGGDVKEDLSNPITPSTRYLEKGDFLKLANATLSYNIGKVGAFRNIAVSLTGQNLFVITKFTGFDPEVNTDKSVDGIPSLGIEYTPYPTARTILLGLNFSL